MPGIKKPFLILIATLLVGCLSYISSFIVLAEEMQSSHYRIQVDSVNVGGLISTTSNYSMNTTIGEIGTGVSTTTNYQMKAGYQQMLEEGYISISVPSTINMSPNIKKLSGGQSNGSGQTTVTTDSASGYSLSIRASASPALTASGGSFADYVPEVPGSPDFTWTIPSDDSEFGFSPEGSHIVQKFQDNGASCNAGSGDVADVCWYNLSNMEETIALSYSANTPTGTVTTLKFRAESGSSHTQAPGTYQATITLTAIVN